MLKIFFLILPTIILFATSCDNKTEQKIEQKIDSTELNANNLLIEAQTLIDSGALQQAKLIIDSVHNSFPTLRTQRIKAKSLADSIIYLEAKTTLAYTETLLPPLFEQVDELIKKFSYEKNDQYENNGRYVHKLLVTNSNTSRNFIQAYVRDNHKTIVKSYYFGNKPVAQNSITLSSDNEEQLFSGTNHQFDAQGHHEIMTLEDEQALTFLSFISTYQNSRIRVKGNGTDSNSSWIYYLNDKEKNALAETYQLGWLMKDIQKIEEIQNSQNEKILNYEQKNKVK